VNLMKGSEHQRAGTCAVTVGPRSPRSALTTVIACHRCNSSGSAAAAGAVSQAATAAPTIIRFMRVLLATDSRCGVVLRRGGFVELRQ
jgi:hypothetical protein